VSSTRERILLCARDLVEQSDGAAPNMTAIAAAVGISRQALYLHFPDRAALLVALVDYVDEREDLQVGIDAINAAPDAVGKLRAFIDMQAWRNPRIAPLGRALDHARRGDPPSARAWQDRADRRLGALTKMTEQLRAEGRLDPSWGITEAAALLSELTSFRVWDDLVSDSKLAPSRYTEIVAAAALATLAAPLP
jgi:AcrR family transcriptional regulator